MGSVDLSLCLSDSQSVSQYVNMSVYGSVSVVSHRTGRAVCVQFLKF